MATGSEPWLQGCTEEGRTVLIERDVYVKRDAGKIIIDGQEANISPGIGAIVRYRDGGTTIIHTDRGKVVKPSPFKRQQLGTLPTLDGKPLFPIPTLAQVLAVKELRFDGLTLDEVSEGLDFARQHGWDK